MAFRIIRRRWLEWVNRRIPRSDSQQFVQSNIFILPTGMGLIFGLLLVVMLLTGINYQNSLIYLLTFLLGVVFVAAMHQTHRNLSGLDLTLVSAGEGFVGDRIPFVFRGTASKEDAVALNLSHPTDELTLQHVMSDAPADLVLVCTGDKRGYLYLERVRVETRFPFGLLKAWSWIRPATPAIVYPKPLMPPEWAGTSGEADNSADTHTTEGHDHADIRPWRQGDLSQRVLWKRYARTGDMVIADWSGEQGSPSWLDYEAFPGADMEMRLSYLSALVQNRARSGEVFGLRLPGEQIGPDSGAAHVHQCMRALAVFGLAKPGGDNRGVAS